MSPRRNRSTAKPQKPKDEPKPSRHAELKQAATCKF